MSTFTSKYKSTPTFTFKGRNKSVTSYNDPSFLPSPNKYNPEKQPLKNSPSAKFPKSIRRQWEQVKCKRSVPGPGSHQSTSYITTGPKKTISQVIFRKIISMTPSPGQYEPNSIILKNKSPSFTMQRKTASMHDLLASKNVGKPSPGDYDQPILKFKSNASITMAKSLRKEIASNNKNPGPGSYDAEKSYMSSVLTQSKCKIGKDKRKIDFSLGDRSPGPGNYDKKSFFQLNKQKCRGFSCRAKILSPIQKFPGPGAYETPIINSHKSAPFIKMAKSLRVSFTDKSIKYFKNNPGPGSFDIEGVQRMKFKSMSVHKFTKSSKNYLAQSLKNQSSAILDPGSYNSNSFFIKKTAPKFSIGHSPNRQLFKKIPMLPGPGQYDPKTSLIHQSQINHKIEKSERSNTVKHLINFPGPGDYETQKMQRLGVNFKFKKQKRANYIQEKLKKQIASTHETYEQRQQFPNPPKYMSVASKLKFNEKKLVK